jgi:hypothetical protein
MKTIKAIKPGPKPSKPDVSQLKKLNINIE